MLGFLGDMHGEVRTLANVVKKLEGFPEITALIQVGDFGFYPQLMAQFYDIKPHIPIYAIDGNHEHFPMLTGLNAVTELATNIFYVPRGTVLELDGRKIAFIGGAASIDKKMRLQYGMSWFEDELVTELDIFKLHDVDKVDILVTHTPPYSVIQKHFPPVHLLGFGVSNDWRDPSADKIEALWNRLGKPPLICGHMHRSVVEGNVRILNIAELFAM